MKLTITCTGDSVTEGMATDGHHYAEYGKAPYPARLKTILADAGYDADVYNFGHGGERTPDVAARLGGAVCYVSETLTIPADNSPVKLGKPVVTDGRVTGTKLKICYADGAGEDYCVYFTQPSHDTNPVMIDGVAYHLSVSDGENVIWKEKPDGKETIIPAGTFVFTADRRQADVSVIYGGINDGASLTLRRWLDLMEACGKVNGGRYIVLGATHALWNRWADVPGETPEEKYAYYRRAAMERFGVHFIDLYDEFARRGLDLALSGGYFADKSAEELAEMRDKLSAHTIPAAFTYNKEADGNVHLSEEGYHVIGLLLFERMKLLGYLEK
ncbi:MAG: SGNH/GDSL hydrolase family protein [Clostridia bacterium]|nr:SGNH/GDSL hydrolase family protein [Clostridia bacterium]